MYNQFLLNDFYKITHLLQYSDKITHLTSYLTPRGSRLKGEGIDKVVMFGLSGYIDDYVVKGFNDNFFNRPWDEIAAEVSEVLVKGLGYPTYMVDKTLEKLKALHALGYLPVEINAVLEGTFVPMGVPCVEIRSTDSRFAWVGQSLEASMSAALWHPMVSATIGAEYRKVARKAFKETVDDTIDERTAMCDFSMRGQESNESAVAASAGWLASMWNSSTVMARSYVKEHYRDGEEVTIGGLTSTEHSVMCTHACLDGGDETHTFGGDNFGCFAPIGQLTVQEVKALGHYIVDNELRLYSDERKKLHELIEKTPADGLQGLSDEDNLGIMYSAVDAFIRENKGSPELKHKVLEYYEKNKFKHEIVQLPTVTFDYPNHVVRCYNKIQSAD